MDFYEKKIRYFDYLEHGNKVKNGGFMKTEVRGGECCVQISVRGLYATDTLQGELFLCGMGTERRVGALLLRKGTGTYMEKWNTDNLGGCGISYADWDGVVIRLSEHRILQNIWRKREAVAASMESRPALISAPEPEAEPEMEVKPGAEAEVQPEIEAESQLEPEPEAEVRPEAESETVPEPEAEPEPEVRPEPEAEPEPEIQPEIESEPEPEIRPEIESEPEPALETAEGKAEKEEKRFQTLYEDKWTQLGQYYKKIHPFGDGREYLSIAPRDFIVLPERYQGLVGNSFLLHGYYNYGHVILGKQQGEDTCRYYLGVPGVYHEREKQVARMFGFEGFEGAAEPAKEGSFGYYMLRVDI